MHLFIHFFTSVLIIYSDRREKDESGCAQEEVVKPIEDSCHRFISEDLSLFC